MGVFGTLVVTVSVVLMIEQEQRDLLPASAPAAPVMPGTSRATENGIARNAAPESDAAPKHRERQRALAKPGPAPVTAQSHGPAAPADITDMQLPERRSEPAATPGKAATMEKKALPEELSAASSVPAPVAAPATAPPAAARRESRAVDRL